VFTASNGIEGLDKAQTCKPHFIITDLSMPEMSGWELATRLKNEVHTRDIPIIALTAHAMTGDRERAMAVGFHNYLSKPLRPESFVTDIIRILLDIPELSFLLG
jgi:CheY-like chemotaxis protein